MASELKILSFRPGDEQAIQELFLASFGRQLPLAYWRWRFADAPAGAAVIKLAWDGGRLAAHYAVTPVRFHAGGQELLTGLSGSTMTHPDYRGQGLFQRLARATYQQMSSDGFAMVWGFPNPQSHRGFVRDLGWTDIHEIPTFRLRLPAARPPGQIRLAVREVQTLDGSFDDLWGQVRGRLPLAAIRDRAYLGWRYLDNPVETYDILACFDGARLCGWAALKRYGAELHIIDTLSVEETSGGVDIVRHAIQLATEQGLSSVSTWLAPQSALHLRLERMGFVNEAPVTYLGARHLATGPQAALGSSYRDWYVCMGDSDVY